MKSLPPPPSDSWYRKTSAFATIRAIVMNGVVRDGITSRRGITSALWPGPQGSGGIRAYGTVSPRCRIVLRRARTLNPDALHTLWNGDRRQGADLLPMRERDDRAAHQASGRRLAVRAAAPLEAPDRRDRGTRDPGAGPSRAL